MPSRDLSWTPRTSTYRQALVYGADGAQYDDESNAATLSWLDDDADGSSSITDTVAEKFARSLAKVACGFQPAGHDFRLQDIETVDVLDVDESHIALSAVLCEARGCVTVAVDVDFPDSCVGSGDGLEHCIVDNINKLDSIATERIRSMEWMDDNEEEVQAQERLGKALTQNSDVQYPDWWVHPAETALPDMPAECEMIRDLLNEDDFQMEIRAVAGREIMKRSEDKFTVQRAGVAAVCPAGIVIRVHAKEERTIAGDHDGLILEVPVSFPSRALSVDDLRALVLQLVDQVE